jgi:hypothetical protein
LHAYRWLTGGPGRDCDPRFTPVSMVKSSCLVERKKSRCLGNPVGSAASSTVLSDAHALLKVLGLSRQAHVISLLSFRYSF